MIVPDEIVSRTLGTGTTKTQLSGDKSGNATDYLVPAWCRSILGTRPFVTTATPAANVGANITLKVESDDLGLKDYEVFANPSASPLSTVALQFRDADYTMNYPLSLPTFGGERVQFYGIQQENHATAFREGATILISDLGAPGLPFRARVGGTAGGAGSNTSTGTATGNVAGATITLSGTLQRLISAAYGNEVPTTYTITDDVCGRFILSAPELAVTIQWAMEAGLGSLGTTGQGVARNSRVEGIAVPIAPPSTIATTLNLEVAPGTAGNFANGIVYQ